MKALVSIPATDSDPPLPTAARKTTPPDEIVSLAATVPPLLSRPPIRVAPVAKPLSNSTSAPPLSTMVPLAAPPEDTFRTPAPNTVALTSWPNTTSEPAPTRVALA